MSRQETPPVIARTRPGSPVLSLIIAIVLAACGSGAGESDEPSASDPGAPDSAASMPAASDPASEEEPSTDAEPPDQPSSDMGSFTVDGTVFAVTLLNRCIPFSDEPGSIDLQPIAEGALLNLSKVGEITDVSAQGTALQEEFGSQVFGEDNTVHESTVSGDRWTGSATVGDSLGSGTTVDIAWDVMVPSEVNDCSL